MSDSLEQPSPLTIVPSSASGGTSVPVQTKRWWATELYPSKDEDNIGIAGDFEVVRVEDLPATLRWTSEKPTKPGWYWWRSKFTCVEVVWVGHFENNPAFQLMVHSGSLDLLDGEWAGPLPVPLAPQSGG